MKLKWGYIITFLGGTFFAFSLLLFLLFFYNLDIVPVESQQKEYSRKIFDISEDKLWGLVQEWRTQENLATYEQSIETCRIADQRLIETKVNWSHDGFEAKRFCPQGCTLSENIARGFSNEQDILDSWLKSASHSANLKMNLPYSCIKSDGEYVVHIFGDI